MAGELLRLVVRALLRHGRNAWRNRPDYFLEYWRCLNSPEMERVPGGWRYRGRFYPDHLFVGGAAWGALSAARRLCRGEGADIGAGFWPFPGATPVDPARGPGKENSLDGMPPGKLDYVFSSHCLEHIDDWQAALDRWVELLRPGGRIFLYLPHPDCEIWHPGSPVVGDGHRWIPTLEAVASHLEKRGLRVIEADPGPDVMGSFYLCAEVPAGVNAEEPEAASAREIPGPAALEERKRKEA